MPEHQTFYYACEIEASIVSQCWHAPERLALIYRELDPAIHLSQPHLRWILEALDLAYRELGSVNFEVVVQVLREMKRLEDCGGLEGLNEIYKLAELGRPADAGERDRKIFDSELAMLKHYAANRAESPPRPPDFFTRGELVLYLNKARTEHPDAPNAVGGGKVAGQLYCAQAWLIREKNDRKFYRIKLVPK